MIRADQMKFNLVGTESGNYVSYARNLAIGLIPTAQALGGYMTKSLMFDGATIIIRFADPFITIYVNKETAGSDMIHGLVSGGTIEFADPDVYGDKDKLQMFYPSSEMADFENIDREFIKEKRIGVLPEADIDITSTYIQMAQAGVICPSMFTGRMRKVVQLLLGTPYFQIKYRWKFSKTHGVYVDSSGMDWLIEVSQQNGVLAMPMPKKSIGINASPNQALISQHFSYIPTGKSFSDFDDLDEAIASGKVRRLMPASGLQEFYQKQAFYEDCGWAFSEDGHGISNTCWNWPGKYKRGYLYEISISEGQDGPESASISKTEEGPIYGFGYAHFPAFSSQFEVKTFDDSIDGSAPYENIGSSWTAPLFVCYSGNSKKVIRGIAETSGTTEFNFGDSTYKYYDMPGGFDGILEILEEDGMMIIGGGYIPGRLCSGTNYISINKSGNYSFVSNNSPGFVGYFSGDGLVAGHSSSYSYKMDLDFEIGETGFQLSRNIDMLLQVTNGWYSQSKQKTYSNGSDYSKNSFSVSPRNRSGYFCGNVSGRSATRGYANPSNPDGLYRVANLVGASDVAKNYYVWYYWDDINGNNDVCADGCFCDSPEYFNYPFSNHPGWPDGAIVYGTSSLFYPPYGTADYNVCSEGYNFDADSYMNMVCFSCSCPTPTSEVVHEKSQSLTFIDHENSSSKSYECDVDSYMFTFYDANPSSVYHMYFNSGSSAFKHSKFNSKMPNGTSGADLDIVNEDQEPIVDSGSRISWVGIA